MDDTEFGFDSGSTISVDRHGNIKGLRSKHTGGIKESIQQVFGWYEGHAGQNLWPTDRASGAYIFRPATQKPQYLDSHDTYRAKIYKGPIVHELHQYMEPGWVSQVIRTYANDPDVEFEWLIGPIPISDGVGKEIITAYSSLDLDSQNTFYTDSNGRQMLKRVKDYRPTWTLNKTEPVSENYYPVNSRIAISTNNENDQFKQITVLTDRSQGGTSMQDGQVL